MSSKQEAPALLARYRRSIDVKRVMQVHRRMIRREIQRREVVPVCFHLRPHSDSKADAAEDFDNLVHHAGDRMLRSDPPASRRHRQVDSCRFRPASLHIERLTPSREAGLETSLELVDGGTVRLPLLEWERRNS